MLTVRIEVADSVRAERGWVYTPGIDDAESECGLDGGGGEEEWDVVLRNDVQPAELQSQLDALVAKARLG